jgi:hypothetical protein
MVTFIMQAKATWDSVCGWRRQVNQEMVEMWEKLAGGLGRCVHGIDHLLVLSESESDGVTAS